MNIQKKYIYIFLIFILLLQNACKETEVPEPVKRDYFLKLYGSFPYEEIHGISVSNNREFTLSGYQMGAEDNEEAWILKTDVQGMVSWKNVYKGNLDIRGCAVYESDYTIFAGYTKNKGENMQNAFIVSFDGQGNKKDSVNFLINALSIKNMKFTDATGKLKLAIHAQMQTEDKIYIYNVNQNLNVNISNESFLGKSLEGFFYLAEQENGDIYISGTATRGSSGSDIYVSFLSGNSLEWFYTYGEQDKSEIASGINMQNDILYIPVTEIADNTGNLYILNISTQGQNPCKSPISLAGNYRSYNMLALPDNQLIITGQKIADDQNSTMFAAKIQYNGTVLLEKEYGYKGLNKGRFVKLLPGDNDFIIAGEIVTSGTIKDAQDIILVKTNEQLEWIQE